MTKKKVKFVNLLGGIFIATTGFMTADVINCPNALFTARGCETQRISIGGFVTANYQWVDVRDKTSGPTTILTQFDFGGHTDPEEFNNFYMKNIRLFIRAELCDNWSGFMSIDFAGRDSTRYQFLANSGVRGAGLIDSSFECRDRLPIFIDRAYIQKRWCASTLRVGYQKVNFGAEEVIPDEYLKTIERSVATNFFMNLGHRAVSGQYIPGRRNIAFGGNGFAERHVGLYLQDNGCNNFHYSLAIVNGYRGLCRNSTQFNDELGYFVGVSYDSCMCGTDVVVGLNVGYQPEGGNWTADSIRLCDGCQPANNEDTSVYGFNPYILANWNCFSLLAEMLFGGVQNAQMTNSSADANPWGFNFIPSYMLSDCWELVGRISYLNTNKMGTSIQNAFGAAPDSGNTVNHAPVGSCKNDTFISSEVQFEKATALYLGVNYYTVNQSVKATLGYEWVKFKNSFQGVQSNKGDSTCNASPFFTGSFVRNSAIVQAVRAQLQIIF